MRIAINCRAFLKKEYTGIGRYAYNLVNNLSKLDLENEYLLYVQKELFDLKRKVPKAPAKNFQIKIDRFKKGPGVTLGPVDIYHSPSPDHISGINGKVVVTVHDIIYKIYPQGHTKETIELTDKQIRSFISNAEKIICPSNSTLQDLCDIFKIAAEKACVIYQGVDRECFYQLKDDALETARISLGSKGIEGPFILFVGTVEPRKNLSSLLCAFADLKKRNVFYGKLVVVGMAGWKNEGIADIIEKLKIAKDVIFTGFVTDDELRCFYNLAEVFVFPSFYEGFGYPIVEAFCCGTPVVTSKTSSCGEIAGDAALTVDPSKVEEISLSVEKVLKSEDLKKGLVKKGLKRSEDFSHIKTARETLDVYKEIFRT